MKAIRVRFLLSRKMKPALARWSMIVKESNQFFKWYKESSSWKVIEEFEV